SPKGPWGTVVGPVGSVDMGVRARKPIWTVAAQTMTRAVAATTGRMPGRPVRRRCRFTRRRTARRPRREGTDGLYQTDFIHAPTGRRVHSVGWCAYAPAGPRARRRCVRAPTLRHGRTRGRADAP